MPMYKRATTSLEEAAKKAKRTPPAPAKTPVANINAAAMSSSGVLQLQRTVGNRAMAQIGG